MAERCGSYPLMNLAEDFGVDYGDVLVWADYLRMERGARGSTPYSRFLQLEAATQRIDTALSSPRYMALLDRLIAHANDRWGKPAPISVPMLVVGGADA